jgi:hypothetical protein
VNPGTTVLVRGRCCRSPTSHLVSHPPPPPTHTHTHTRPPHPDTCSPHRGAVNSWDRDVYLWDALDGSTTFIKDPDVFTRNALLGDYSTLCAVDNDDGSSYFTVHNNFMAYGGG